MKATRRVPPRSSGGSGFLGTQTVYVRREFVYLAEPNMGYVRIGEADGLIGIFDGGGKTTGVFLAPTGTLVGGNLQGAARYGGMMAPYFGAQSGNEYGTLKAVYLSPQFNGFDFGVAYAPSPFNGYAGNAHCTNGAYAGFACTRLSSTDNPAGRPRFSPDKPVLRWRAVQRRFQWREDPRLWRCTWAAAM